MDLVVGGTGFFRFFASTAAAGASFTGADWPLEQPPVRAAVKKIVQAAILKLLQGIADQFNRE